jgi:hypothetical protein
LCKVGIAGWSIGVECVERRGSLVTCWDRMEGEGVGRGKEWMTRGRKISWTGEQWILAQEEEGE